jgi:Cu/Ag efflux protein CusF
MTMIQERVVIALCGGALLILAGTLAPALAHHPSSSAQPMSAAEHAGTMPMHMEMTNQGIFAGRGKVIALVPAKQQIVVGHEEIKGFMAAMPMGMGYPVESAELLEGLHPGDQIIFTIDAAKKKIIAIEKVP